MAPKVRPPIERFNEKIRHAENGCIEWTAYVGENGYGRFYFEGRGALAHRWSYEFHVGPIPEGLVIDHLCRNHRCVNPEHLEPVTTSENVRRGDGPRLRSAQKGTHTHCPRGHAYTEENTYTYPASGDRACWTCKRDRARKHYQRNRELTIERARAWRLENLERSREVAREATRRYRAKQKTGAN